MKTKLEVVTFLLGLSKMYIELGDINRASSFSRAATNIRDEKKIADDVEVTSSDFKGIHGVGASTLNEISEFTKTGTSVRYAEVKSKLSDEAKLASALDDKNSDINKALDKLKLLKKGK